MQFRFQYPHNNEWEARLLNRFHGSPLLELVFALRRWRRYYLSSIKRAARFLSYRYCHIRLKGHVELPPDFVFDPTRASPRGAAVGGAYFSSGYDLSFAALPPELLALISSCGSVLGCFFASPVNVRAPHLWRNIHIPADVLALNQEVFADAFHQDLVFDQFNAQLFVLLHDTTADHGPLEYLDPQIQAQEMPYYRRRNRKAALSTSNRFVGRRGDFLLLSTGSTLHKASNPAEGHSRDILSIAFFPAYTSYGTPIEQL